MVDEESLDLMYKCIRLNRTDKVKELLDNEPDMINEQLGAISWPFLAISEDSLEVLGLLIEYGVSPDTIGGNHHRSLLCEAAANDNLRIAKYLVEMGAKVDEYDELKSPLLSAIWADSLACVNYFANQGVDLDHVYRFATADMTIKEYALKYNKNELAKLIDQLINHEEVSEEMILPHVKEKILTDEDKLEDEDDEEDFDFEQMYGGDEPQENPNDHMSSPEKEELSQLKKEFIEKATTFLEELTEEKCKVFFDDLKLFFSEVKMKIERCPEDEHNIKQIMILFQNIEYYFGNFMFRMQAFDEDATLKDEFYGKNTDGRWLMEPFFEYEDKLIKFQDKFSKPTEWRLQECRKMITTYLKIASFYLQYNVREFCIKEENLEMFWTEETIIWFGQCAGNWTPIYARRKLNLPVDMTEIKNHRYIHFKGEKWRKQKWVEVDFTKAIFEKCVFQHMTFDESIWNNCIFTDCVFKNVKWQGGSVYGAHFTNCKFYDVETNEVLHTKEHFDEEGIFRAVVFRNCLEEGLCNILN